MKNYEDEFEELMERIANDPKLVDEMIDIDLSHVHPIKNIFTVNGYDYEIDIQPAKYTKGAVIGSFRLMNNPNQPQFRDFDGDIKKYLKAKEDAEMGDVKLKGSGVRVIDTVGSVFKVYIEKNKPEIFIFHARDDKRSKGYLTIGNYIAKRTGYVLKHKKDPSTGITEFWLCSPIQEIDTSRLTESIKQYRFYQNYISNENSTNK